MIEQADLVNELQALQQQRQEHANTLQRIEGAIELTRHLLAKSQQKDEAKGRNGESDSPPLVPELVAARNGTLPEAASE